MDHAESIGQPEVVTLGRKMDGCGVIKHRYRKYASLYFLLNFTACSMTSLGTGHLNTFIRTMSLAFCQTRFCREQAKYIIMHSTEPEM